MSGLDIKVHIIAREGSKRVIRKNLRLLNGKPLVSYAIESALSSKILQKENIFLNTECPNIAEIGTKYGIPIYNRDPKLAEDDVVLDELTYDFTKNNESEIVGMVNPVCPLTSGQDIDSGLTQFIKDKCDSLITVREEQLQTFVDDKPINFVKKQKIDKTQDLTPAQVVTWNYCFWKSNSFIKSYQKDNFAVFNGKISLFPINKLNGIKISNEDDFMIAESIIKNFG